MSENETPNEKPNGETKPVVPICPHCLADPFVPQAIPFNAENGVQLLIFFCGDCRKALNSLILHMPQPRVQPAGRRTVLPRGFSSQ